MFKGKDKPTPGLFCSNHDVFLDWLSVEDATLLIDNGLKESAYSTRKKPKRKKSKTSRYKTKSRQYNGKKKLDIATC